MKVRRKKSKKQIAKSEVSQEPEDNDGLFAFTYEGVEYMTLLTKKFTERKPYSPPNPKLLHAFIPGKIVKVFAKDKQKIKKGEVLLSLKAMKMNNDILSSIDGTIKKILVKKGEVVVKNQLLVELK
ncbi:MAG: acetyl-CoA carboxylase biotin carboxyl carrier protein subunit [Bacteroidia bacterium]|nr:acetyl-CoA carboxylase biotin carboxyl carrier protein subunit [Bacteroidia bacterium]